MGKDVFRDNGYDNLHCEYTGDKVKKEILTTVVRIKGSSIRVVPVKSNKPIDKSLFLECSKALSRIYVGVPINVGDIICHNILNTGIDIICTKRVDKK